MTCAMAPVDPGAAPANRHLHFEADAGGGVLDLGDAANRPRRRPAPAGGRMTRTSAARSLSGSPVAPDGPSGPRGSGSTRTLGAGDENEESGYQDGTADRPATNRSCRFSAFCTAAADIRTSN